MVQGRDSECWMNNEHTTITNWLDDVLAVDFSEEITAIAFNLYDNEGDMWSLEVVGTSSFDAEDSDWACDEVTDFGTRDNPFVWKENAEWSDVLKKAESELSRYLKDGKNAAKLLKLDGVGVGFVDGDMEIIFSKQ